MDTKQHIAEKAEILRDDLKGGLLWGEEVLDENAVLVAAYFKGWMDRMRKEEDNDFEQLI